MSASLSLFVISRTDSFHPGILGLHYARHNVFPDLHSFGRPLPCCGNHAFLACLEYLPGRNIRRKSRSWHLQKGSKGTWTGMLFHAIRCDVGGVTHFIQVFQNSYDLGYILMPLYSRCVINLRLYTVNGRIWNCSST